MDTNSVIETPETFEPLLSTTELAERLQVSVQTLYDLRSHGRGPRGFRVGRELRFRVSEVRAWLARMEADDAARHPGSQSPAP
ncbi:MAG: helix-turn-helix transcriptional regulator [Marmoricola sp.]